MQARANFDPDTKWYTGQGCVICGSNYSIQGAEAGIQAIDFEVTDPIDGRIGICYSHAREVGVLVGMVDKSNLDEVMASASRTYEVAGDLRVAALEDREAAAADRAIVERFMDRFNVAAPEPAPEAAPVPEKPKRGPGRPKKSEAPAE